MSLHKYLSPLLPVFKTARASSVSDPHSLYVDLDPAFLENADPYPYLALRMNTDPDLGEMLKYFLTSHKTSP
jgi:hypothetical protein